MYIYIHIYILFNIYICIFFFLPIPGASDKKRMGKLAVQEKRELSWE